MAKDLSVSLLGFDKKEEELRFGFSIQGGTEEQRFAILSQIEDLIVGINRRPLRERGNGLTLEERAKYVPEG